MITSSSDVSSSYHINYLESNSVYPIYTIVQTESNAFLKHVYVIAACCP